MFMLLEAVLPHLVC